VTVSTDLNGCGAVDCDGGLDDGFAFYSDRGGIVDCGGAGDVVLGRGEDVGVGHSCR